MTERAAKPQTRVLIHADDVGMCHGANRAFVELTAAGFLDAGSIMAPSPWFSEVAAMAADDPSVDLGVHLTLTSEMGYYRWRPLTQSSPASGLVDGDGYLWRSVAELRQHCEPEAAETEMRAQIDRALAAGIDVTHADTHMFAALAPEYCDAYLDIAEDYRIPVMLAETFDAAPLPAHLRDANADPYRATLSEARDKGLPVFDQLIQTVWRSPEDRWDTCQHLFERVAGLTYMALHPTAPGDIEAIDPRTAESRIGEYDMLSDPEFEGWLDLQALSRITWRDLRDQWRASFEE